MESSVTFTFFRHDLVIEKKSDLLSYTLYITTLQKNSTERNGTERNTTEQNTTQYNTNLKSLFTIKSKK